MVVAEAEAVLEPRLCVLKSEAGEALGFQLTVEKEVDGHIIRQVVSGGLAERSGLKDGDRLLEVNEMFVDNMSHVEVVCRIHMCGSPLCFLVLDKQAYEQAWSKGHDLREMAHGIRGKGWKPPRLCHIRKNASGLGFAILPEEGQKGKFTVNIASGGSAEKAGVKKGDQLIWINGAMVSEMTHSAISKMMKKCSDHMTVLVIGRESEKTYVCRKMPILPAMADGENMPYRPRRIHLVMGPDGYGLLVRHERHGAGRGVHVLGAVDEGGPAETGGITAGDLLLEVNGEPTDSLSHDGVVSKIRQSGQQVTLVTLSPKGQEFYTKLGLSPLLFSVDAVPQGPMRREKMEKSNPLAPPVESQEDDMVNPNVRLCQLQKGESGFGFHLGSVQQKPGTFISQVTVNGPGQSSGLLKGDVVVEVNGQKVENESVEDVILCVKKGGSSLALLVVDQPGFEWLKKNKKPVTVSRAAVNSEMEKTATTSASESAVKSQTPD